MPLNIDLVTPNVAFGKTFCYPKWFWHCWLSIVAKSMIDHCSCIDSGDSGYHLLIIYSRKSSSTVRWGGNGSIIFMIILQQLKAGPHKSMIKPRQLCHLYVSEVLRRAELASACHKHALKFWEATTSFFVPKKTKWSLFLKIPKKVYHAFKGGPEFWG